MPIVVQCSCGRVLKARDEFAGSRAECPTCGKLVQIPEASAENHVDAPSSGATATGSYFAHTGQGGADAGARVL